MKLPYSLRTRPAASIVLLLISACGTDTRPPLPGSNSQRNPGTHSDDPNPDEPMRKRDGGGGGVNGGAGGAMNGETGGAPANTDACQLVSSCDDENPCTQDSCVEGHCRNQPLDDGVECVTASLCASSGVCTGGKCLAPTTRSEPSVLNTTQATGESGTESFDFGISAFVAPGTLVDVDHLGYGSRISLSVHQEGRLRIASRIWSSRPYKHLGAGGEYWITRQASHVVPLPGRRFIYVNSTGIELYSFEGNDLNLVSSAPLYRKETVTGVTVTSGVDGDTIWLAQRLASVSAYAVDANGTISHEADVPLSAAVFALDADDSGKHLWLGTDNEGLLELDVSDLENIHLTGRNALTGDQFFVQARAGLLLAQELRPLFDRGDVVILRTDTLEELARFREQERWLTGPVAGKLLSSQDVLIQWQENERVSAQIYRIEEDDSLTLLHETPYFAGSYRVWGPQAAPHTGAIFDNAGSTELVVEPHRTPLSVRATKALRLTGPARGSFRDLVAESDHNLLAFGNSSSHRLTATADPALRLEEGERYNLENTEGLHVLLGDGRSKGPTLVNRDFSNGGLTSGPEEYDASRTQLLLLEAKGELPRPSKHFDLEGQDVSATVSGSTLYQLSKTAEGGALALQTTSLSALESRDELRWRDFWLEADWGEKSTNFRLAVDHPNEQILVGFYRLGETNTSRLYWFSRAQDEYRLTAEQELSSPGAPFAFSERLFLILGEKTLRRIEQEAGQVLTLQERVFEEASIDAVLHADDELILVAARIPTPGASQSHLLALDASSFETLFAYPSENPVTSLALLGEVFAYGSRTSATLASPPCGTTNIPESP